MPTDTRLKYINSQIADLGSSGLVDSIVDNSQLGLEAFEGGIHVGRARTMFLVFAAVIMILYVLDE
jgi:hypothetical protein